MAKRPLAYENLWRIERISKGGRKPHRRDRWSFRISSCWRPTTRFRRRCGRTGGLKRKNDRPQKIQNTLQPKLNEFKQSKFITFLKNYPIIQWERYKKLLSENNSRHI